MTQEEFLRKADEVYEDFLRQGSGCGAAEICGLDLINLLIDYKEGEK